MEISLSLSLTGRLLSSAFSPALLFALAEPGVWYDPSDLTTLFQDTAGTTPVTTPGQTVALALDKSKGLVLGSEQSPALPDYQTVLTGTWAASGANYVFTDTVGGQSRPGVQWPTISLAAGTYQLVVVVAAINGATQIRLDGVGATDQLLTVGSNTRIVSVTSTSRPRFRLEDLSTTIGDSFTITSISVKELPGFHATQATAASRPTYGVVPRTGRRNLLTRTEEFENAVWAKTNATVTANAGTAPDGTTTADLLTSSGGETRAGLNPGILAGSTSYVASMYGKFSNANGRYLWFRDFYAGRDAGFDLQNGVVTQVSAGMTASVVALPNGWYRCVAAWTTPTTPVVVNQQHWVQSASGTNVSSGTLGGQFFIWGAQLETGSTATAYQRVGSAFDVTEAGVASLSYLSFDGVDDFLVTPTITPGIDKAQVFAGVRKLSDAAAGIVVESSVSNAANAGSFYLAAPEDVTIRYSSLSRGSSIPTTAMRASTTGSAPDTAVLTATHDIAGDLSTIRRNAVDGTSATSDKGTGNFLAYPLYIGRRGGTTLPFNGQIYSLIVRFGTNLDAGTITSTETWVNGKTGAYA